MTAGDPLATIAQIAWLRYSTGKIEFEGRPPTTKLSLNPHRLSRAVHNIVFNAVDVMPDGGAIRAAVRSALDE